MSSRRFTPTHASTTPYGGATTTTYHGAARTGIPAFLTPQNSMHKLILDIRSASSEAKKVPRSRAAASLRKAEEAHRRSLGAATLRWNRLKRYVLRPLAVRQWWHAAIAAAVEGKLLPKQKPQWAIGKATQEQVRLTMTVDDMIKTIEATRPNSAASTPLRGAVPIGARPPWTGKWDTHQDKANYLAKGNPQCCAEDQPARTSKGAD